MKFVLLMTASVDATGCSGARFVASKRLLQYKKAFAFYLKVLPDLPPGTRLMFCENTGWDLSCFRDMIPESLISSVDVCEIPLDGFNKWYGKTYNEMLLIDKALTAVGREEMMVVKVTGRYPIYNIEALIKDIVDQLGTGNDNVDCVCLPAQSISRRVCITVDTRCIAFKSTFWISQIVGAYRFGDKLFFGEIMMRFLDSTNTRYFRRPFFIIGEQGGYRRIGRVTLPAFFDPPLLLVSFLVRKIMSFVVPPKLTFR